jgi:hypothetical protein
VNCGEILRQLMERDLVRIGGRSHELGRPYLYATTKRFLELFGLNQIDELPRRQELRTIPLPAAATEPGFCGSTEAPRSTGATRAAGISGSPVDETTSETTFG